MGRSHDSGSTWEPVGDLGSLGGQGTLPVAPIALDPEEVGSAYVGTGAGVYVWDDRPSCSSPRTLCIDQQPGDRRWRVTVSYASTRGGGTAGAAAALPLASLGIGRGGLFRGGRPWRGRLLALR